MLQLSTRLSSTAAPGQSEIEHWAKLRRAGVSNTYIISGFVGSDEFTNLCANYGMTRGTVKAPGVMLSVMEYRQHPDYPTGCESAALYILLKYYNVNVTMEEIVNALPKGAYSLLFVRRKTVRSQSRDSNS